MVSEAMQGVRDRHGLLQRGAGHKHGGALQRPSLTRIALNRDQMSRWARATAIISTPALSAAACWFAYQPAVAPLVEDDAHSAGISRAWNALCLSVARPPVLLVSWPGRCRGSPWGEERRKKETGWEKQGRG